MADHSNVDAIFYADVSTKGIKYSIYHFNAKVTVKDPDTKKDIEVTVVRKAEREWICGSDNWYHSSAHGGVVFNLDESKCKAKAEEMFAFLLKP